MAEKVLIDCDNTMGIPGMEIDDGLVILLMAASKKVEIKGITGVFGNGSINQVMESTQNLIEQIGLTDLPLYRGAKSKNNYNTKAAEFLVNQVNKNPEEINILAIGPLTNIAGAYKLDNDFFKKVKSIVVMGGITDPLVFNGKTMDELNFSSDHKAAYTVLSSESSIVLANANLCLQAFFGKKEMEFVEKNINGISKYIKPWYNKGEDLIGKKGFYMWDLVAALYLIKPELFEDRYYYLRSTIDDFKKGKLKVEEQEKADKNERKIINMPTKIKDIELFKRTIFNLLDNYDIDF
ncbi:MAG: nucleoside hydrolase [Halanaerobiales bacterium]|nr:nucleoside hydrolase [Halanaerobiales bacterium]